MVKIYFCFTIISMLALFILTVVNLATEKWKKGEDDDLSISIIQIVGIGKALHTLHNVLQK